MKVDSKHISECFNEIKLILIGMAETLRSGDDGCEDACLTQSQYINTIIAMFTAEHMTPVVKPQRHSFLTRCNEIDEPKNFSENQEVVKARLYLWLKREAPKLDIPVTLNENKAYDFIYDEIVLGTSSERWWYGQFDKCAIAVLNLVVKEIYDERRKHPQLAMPFQQSADQPKSLKLVDRI